MKNSHNRKLHIFTGLCAIPIIAIFLLTSSVNVNAASASTYFPMSQDVNGLIDPWIVDYVETNYSGYYYLLYGPNYISNYEQYHFIIFSDPSTLGIGFNQNGYQFSITGFYDKREVKIQKPQYWYWDNQDFGNSWANMNSDLYDNSISYVSNCDIVGPAGPLIYLVPPITVPSSGHAQNPINNFPTIQYPIGMHPTSVPTVPTYTAPSLSTAPSIDTSSVSSILESIFNLLSWVLESIVLYIVNFINTFVEWLQFLGNLIVWLFKSYIDWLNNFVDWLYNIFKFLFEPIFDFLGNFFRFLFNEDDQLSIYDQIKQFKEFVVSWCSGYWSNSWLSDFFTNLVGTYDYFATLFTKVLLFFDKLILLGTVNNEFSISNLIHALFVPDAATVTAHLMGHDDFYFYSTGHVIVQKGNYIVNTISSLTPAKTFYVPSTTWHNMTIGGFYLDFSWYDDYKTYGDLIISTFLSLSFVYWVLINMSNFIRGQSSVGSDVSRLEK